MTLLKPECPASSKLYSLMGSQGISGRGVNDRILSWLFSSLHITCYTLNHKKRDYSFLSGDNKDEGKIVAEDRFKEVILHHLDLK
jgi:hypothetical protein